MKRVDTLTQILLAPADIAAKRLLGATLVRELPGGVRFAGKIVETEAYDQTDAASHSYRGRTPRTDVMFGPAGHLYVYFTYGMHYCCNIVTGPAGHGAAVLIRAVEPLEGIEEIAANRRILIRSSAHKQLTGRKLYNLTNGPAKFCQAFGIDKTWNGHDLRHAPLRIELHDAVTENEIISATRIGISQAKEKPWRFYIRDNPWVSRTA